MIMCRGQVLLKAWQITFRLQSSNLFSLHKSLLTTLIKTAFISILISGPQVNITWNYFFKTPSSNLQNSPFSAFKGLGGFGHLVWNYLSGLEFSFYHYFASVSLLFLLLPLVLNTIQLHCFFPFILLSTLNQPALFCIKCNICTFLAAMSKDSYSLPPWFKAH